MSNIYKRLLGILPSDPRDKGEVVAVNPDVVTVELVTGARVRVHGADSGVDWNSASVVNPRLLDLGVTRRTGFLSRSQVFPDVSWYFE